MASQPLQGYVTVELDEPMEMKGIKVYLKGEADVHWTETRTTGSGDDERTETVTYSAHEKYIDQKVYIFGRKGGHEMLQYGRHTFPFQFVLPNTIPSSFEGDYGNVRYELKAKIKRPSKSDPKTKRRITVISILDLNVQPNVMTAQEGQAQKTLCCLCCESGPIIAHMKIDRRGYVPGESLVICGEVSNGSNREMSSSKVKLVMHTTFHATTSSRTSTTKICEIKKGEIPGGDTEVWTGERLHIPPLPPSELLFCNIINIKYFVMMVVDPTGPAFDLEIPLEVVIGTIPLREVPPMWFPQAPVMTLPAGAPEPVVNQPVPMTAYPAAPSPPLYPNAPPRYNECVFGKVTVKDDNTENDGFWQGDQEWAPSYTYYDWSRPPPGEQGPPGVDDADIGVKIPQ